MSKGDLFIMSNEKRLQTYFGYPTYMTCARPIIGRALPPFEYESDEERFSNCSCSCPNNLSRCRRNYYSPFD